jgi:hypothetical protein
MNPIRDGFPAEVELKKFPIFVFYFESSLAGVYMRERRKCLRLPVFKSAKLVVKKSVVFDCVVRDLTNIGARIGIPNTIFLPEALEITFDGGRSIRPCRLVWRTFSGAGVEFSENSPLLA